MTERNGGRRWLVMLNGSVFTSYDTREECERYIRMQREKKDWCPKGEQTYAAKQSWTVRERTS